MSLDLRVREIIADFITPCPMAPEEMRAETLIVDGLGADSIEIIEISLALEEEFEIEIPDEKTETFKTVGDIVKFVQDAKSEE